MRYINQIDIPVRSIDYKDYFLTTPEVSRELPQMLSVSSCSSDAAAGPSRDADPDPGSCGSVSTRHELRDTRSGRLSRRPELTSDDQVWDVLEKLRERKNSYFEGC